jgi:hypothetical protein
MSSHQFISRSGWLGGFSNDVTMASSASSVASTNSQGGSVQKETEDDKKKRIDMEDDMRREARMKSRREAQRSRDARDIRSSPRGCFSYRVESLRLNIQPDKSLKRVGISFGVISEKEDTDETAWWVAPKPILGTVKEKGLVVFDKVCMGTTKQFTLTEEFLTRLLTKKLSISVYELKGESLNTATDVLLGKSHVVLNQMLVEDKPEVNMQLSLKRLENGKGCLADDSSPLSVLLTCDDELAEYVLGSCVIDCGPVTIANPPISWTLEQVVVEAEDGTKSTQVRSPMAIKEMMDGGKLGQSFTLSPTSNGLIPLLSFNKGTVTYVPPPPTLPTSSTSSPQQKMSKTASLPQETPLTNPIVRDFFSDFFFVCVLCFLSSCFFFLCIFSFCSFNHSISSITLTI